MKKTKNKVKLVLNIPAKSYTLRELFKFNPQFQAEITVRVRHKKMEEEGKVSCIGNLTGLQGAPQKVYAQTPITQIVISEALQKGIQLVDNAEKRFSVAIIKPSTPKTDVKNLISTSNDVVLDELET